MAKSAARANLSVVGEELSEAHVPLSGSRVNKSEIREAQDEAINRNLPAFPSLHIEKKEVMVGKSFRFPLKMAQELERVCRKYGIKEESKLVRDFVEAGLKSLK